MRLLDSIKWKIKAFLESHPLGYYIGNKVINSSNLFLPHEEDFYGFRKLCNNKHGLFLDGMEYKRSHSILIRFMRANALHKNVYSISSHVYHIFPAVIYANVNYSSRLLHLFWVPGMVKSAATYPNRIPSQQQMGIRSRKKEDS